MQDEQRTKTGGEKWGGQFFSPQQLMDWIDDHLAALATLQAMLGLGDVKPVDMPPPSLVVYCKLRDIATPAEPPADISSAASATLNDAQELQQLQHLIWQLLRQTAQGLFLPDASNLLEARLIINHALSIARIQPVRNDCEHAIAQLRIAREQWQRWQKLPPHRQALLAPDLRDDVTRLAAHLKQLVGDAEYPLLCRAEEYDELLAFAGLG